MRRIFIEDEPPYRSYRPTRFYRLRRWIVATDIPFALWFTAAVLVAAACILSTVFMVSR